jgi:hypothetical protein
MSLSEDRLAVEPSVADMEESVACSVVANASQRSSSDRLLCSVSENQTPQLTLQRRVVD